MTSATGFIGNHVVKRLTQAKHKIVCLVRQTNHFALLQNQSTDLIIGDVTDRASLVKGMEGCDAVINLANVYSFWEPNKQIYTQVWELYEKKGLPLIVIYPNCLGTWRPISYWSVH